jgi:putative iron-dependent peroxidase
MPATQHDVVVWLAGASYDVVFDLSRSVVVALRGIADLVHEIVGFQYHHDLDLTGFIDGLENPTLVEATSVALLPEGAPGAGGSVLLLQQWQHRADEWESLPVAQQELIMGRRKSDGAELDPPPEDSHVGRTDQEDFGKIFRRNVAYGTLARHGTIFVGFCRDQRILQAMLESMVGAGGPSIDRLTTVTQPITGDYYFVPSADALAARGANERTDPPAEPD